MYYIEKAGKVLGIDGNIVGEEKNPNKGEFVEKFRVGSNIRSINLHPLFYFWEQWTWVSLLHAKHGMY